MVRRILTVIIPWFLASTVGILVFVHFFVSGPGMDPLLNGLVEWATIIAAFGILLGLVNVGRVHGRRILQRQTGWPYSLVLILSALAVLVLGLMPGSAGSGDIKVQWVFRHVLEPLSTTLFSLLAFFLASAFFRALRLRNVEAVLVTLATVVVLLGHVPSSPLWSFLEYVKPVKDWLLNVPAMAGVRAILIGGAIGALATAMRVLLGLERPYAE